MILNGIEDSYITFEQDLMTHNTFQALQDLSFRDAATILTKADSFLLDHTTFISDVRI